MTRARDIADLVDANGDVKAGHLDNVPPADLVNDTTPQLGGVLDTNGNNIRLGDSSGSNVNRVQLGASQDFAIYHDGSNSIISDGGTGNLLVRADANTSITSANGSTVSGRFRPSTHVSLYYNGSEKLATSSSGVTVTGDLSVSGSVGGLVLMNKQTTTIYTTTASTHNVDFSNIPSDGTAKAALVTLYVGSDGDHIDWHFGRSTGTGASWSSGSNDPGWSNGWGDILLTWVGNVGGYSWWMGSLVIPVNSNGSFNATCAGASNLGNRLRIAGIGYFK